jgi:holo-[acyl-carrier protein] synthase
MEKVHLGIDIVEISRIKQAVTRWQSRFIDRVYTQNEQIAYQHKVESLAARFAGKEAVMKALNAPFPSISWNEVEILSDTDGKPLLTLYGKALDKMRQLGLSNLEISLSHSRQNAIALVIGLRER